MDDLGLVLSGGGFRGAYQAGFLQSLAESAVTPAMISGTSVGALNGFAAAAGGLGAPEQLWRSTGSFRKVLGVRYRGLAIRGLLLFASLPELWEMRRVYRKTPGGFAGAMLEKYAASSEALTNDSFGLVEARATIAILTSVVLVGFAAGGLHIHNPRLLALVMFSISAAVATAYFFGVPFFWRRLESSSVSAFKDRVQPLLIASAKGMSRPTPFSLSVTSTVVVPLFDYSDSQAFQCAKQVPLDPCAPTRFRLRVRHWIARGWAVPAQRARVVPRYTAAQRGSDLHGLLPYAAASMALPLGILPAAIINGERHWDGGVADNIPIHPVLSNGAIRRIVILDVSAKRQFSTTWAYRHANYCGRLSSITDYIERRTMDMYEAMITRAAPERCAALGCRSGFSLHSLQDRVTPLIDRAVLGPERSVDFMYFNPYSSTAIWRMLFATKGSVQRLLDLGKSDGVECARLLSRS